MGELEDKVAIITGGAGDIGRATASRFVREGARVLLVDRDEAVHDVAASLGDRARGHVADVTREDDTEAYVAAACDAFGGLDVLFANAGIEGAVAPITAQTLDGFARVMQVNVLGVFLAIKHAAPRMAARGGGAIVVTSSVAGVVGQARLSAYSASKHAVVGLVKTAALELGRDRIRVNAVNPGPVEGRMMGSIEDQSRPGRAAEVKQGYTSVVPLCRYATSDEIASAVLFLSSDASSIVTGTTLLADGGFAAR